MDRPLGPNANSFERSPVRTAARSIFLVFGLCVVACNTPARAQEDEARRGLWVSADLGYGSARVSWVVKGLREGFLFENAHTPVSGTGWGVTVGLGYDVRLSQWLSIGPRVAFAHGDVGTLHSPVQAPVATGWKQNVLSVSVRII